MVDATDQVLGRMCAKVAKILRGKYKPCYTPHVDCGDNVIIINADKVQLTGKKMDGSGLFELYRLSRWSKRIVSCRFDEKKENRDYSNVY